MFTDFRKEKKQFFSASGSHLFLCSFSFVQSLEFVFIDSKIISEIWEAWFPEEIHCRFLSCVTFLLILSTGREPWQHVC